MNEQEAFDIALEEARISYHEGGIPIGAALVSREGRLLGKGHNLRMQKGSPIHHGEISALQDAKRLPAKAYKGSTMYTTTGACILFGISRVVIGENNTFLGGERYLKERGIEVTVLGNKECQELMERFIKEKPEAWYEDIGEEAMVRSKETNYECSLAL
ncbi:cytosine deaminase [Phlyctema vagabunda]|uniref:Cytosine deaminase n=1 Tax=Phlyctema vagabunda TaxID=108571 RepID=A0ABR4P6N8_9HELO